MFIPHTDTEREAMLATMGVNSVDILFEVVPEEFRYPELNIPAKLSEMEVVSKMVEISSANQPVYKLASFLGAGAYNHYSPAAVDALIQRGEFLTAYTPYQPEVSQGTLQAIFEYQSMITALTGMEVSNASHYDGATAVAEAVNMAYHHFRGKRLKVILSPALHPHYRSTVRTYTQGSDIIVEGDENPGEIYHKPERLLDYVDDDTAIVVVQYPDFFGRIYDFTSFADSVHASGALLAISVNPIALGLLKTPGDFGADIVTGEGQPLGLPLSFGGPYLGIFATREQYVRKMAGRLVGETKDADGKRGYVLTLATREQHIRREKATSNICTNQGLMALASTIYMSLLGKSGLRKVSELCYQKAHYASMKISSLPGFELTFDAPFFNEFTVTCPIPAAKINQKLLTKQFIGGYDLGLVYPALQNHLLVAVTEMNTREQIDRLVTSLAEVAHV